MERSSIISGMEKITPDEWDKFRLKLYKDFKNRLDKLPDASDPEDILHDAIGDVLDGRRACPDGVPLFAVLYNTVKSKVSHMEDKWKRRQYPKQYEDTRTSNQVANSNVQAIINEEFLSQIEDPFIKKMINLKISEPNIKPKEIAETLEVDIREIYNVSRRLKVLLPKLWEQYQSKN